ncbi:unnamed protein product [Callosobruchus maculatus]|uniref:Uncharacterized protein n=1 Tax=Callosobruchus maculatus TaxID=64391 RepID=A0A653BM71_CALMS|nr:unnamed protein product [Callosobruchus maculatus]
MLRLYGHITFEKGCCTLNIFDFPGHLLKVERTRRILTKESFSY